MGSGLGLGGRRGCCGGAPGGVNPAASRMVAARSRLVTSQLGGSTAPPRTAAGHCSTWGHRCSRYSIGGAYPVIFTMLAILSTATHCSTWGHRCSRYSSHRSHRCSKLSCHGEYGGPLRLLRRKHALVERTLLYLLWLLCLLWLLYLLRQARIAAIVSKTSKHSGPRPQQASKYSSQV